MTILDEVAKSAAQIRYGQFRPATTQEFFALRLAAKLGDAGAAQHYAELADKFSQGQLLAAYARALPSNIDPARRFHVELESLKGRNGGDQGLNPLAAVRVERRAVGFAILRGDHLVHADARQLSSVPDQALDNAVSFATRFLERFRCESAALEMIPNGHEVQRTLLHQAVLRVLSAQGIGIIEVSKDDFLAASGHPAPRFTQRGPRIISGMYPALDQQPGSPWTRDAAALGLYVQTERLSTPLTNSSYDRSVALYRRQEPSCQPKLFRCYPSTPRMSRLSPGARRCSFTSRRRTWKS